MRTAHVLRARVVWDEEAAKRREQKRRNEGDGGSMEEGGDRMKMVVRRERDRTRGRKGEDVGGMTKKNETEKAEEESDPRRISTR
eukprot:3068714-Rhodomonas_salina.1